VKETKTMRGKRLSGKTKVRRRSEMEEGDEGEEEGAAEDVDEDITAVARTAVEVVARHLVEVVDIIADTAIVPAVVVRPWKELLSWRTTVR